MNKKYHGAEPWSFGSFQRVKDYNRELSKNEIRDFLASNDIFTRFKQHRKSRRYSPIYVYSRRELFQADVIFFTDPEMVKANSGFKYLFTCIDCFTKMAWAYPLKENTCEAAMNSFKDILNKCGDKPQRLNSDRGSEFICKEFKTFLREQNIFHYVSFSLRKCPIIERFQLTIQNLLYKIMAFNRSFEWTKFLDHALHIYLNRTHSTIKMSPLDGEKKANEKIVRNNLHQYFLKRGGKKQKPKFSVGDKVRIWGKRRTFQRGYDENYTREYFVIKKILTNLPVPRYTLADSKNEAIVGSFFTDELERFVPSENFEIEVKKKRKRGRIEEYLVHYIGYPSSMDEWVNKEQLVKL